MPSFVKVRLDPVARAAGEHRLLGKKRFKALVQLLRTNPDCGVPLQIATGRLRAFRFDRVEIITRRTSADQLIIVSIR